MIVDKKKFKHDRPYQRASVVSLLPCHALLINVKCFIIVKGESLMSYPKTCQVSCECFFLSLFWTLLTMFYWEILVVLQQT